MYVVTFFNPFHPIPFIHNLTTHPLIYHHLFSTTGCDAANWSCSSISLAKGHQSVSWLFEIAFEKKKGGKGR